MNTSEIHGDAFRVIVLKHLQELLPASEWARLRALRNCKSPLPLTDADYERQAVVTPEQLVQAALSDEGMSLEVLLMAFKGASMVIAQLEGQPVYYFEGEGIYAWALRPDASSHLSIWVTHPAYPPNW